MILREYDKKLKSICRAFEKHVTNVMKLRDLILEVELLPKFDNLPESSAEAIKKTPAAYRKSTNRIYVNDAIFFSFDEDIQEAFLAYEIAHAILQNAVPELIEGIEISECIKADLIACEWGFYEALKNERLESYGQKYVDCLALWQDITRFNDCMASLYRLRLSGQLQETMSLFDRL